MKTRLQLSVAVLAVACSRLAADDWPQWRGINRTGVSTETDLLKSWPEEGLRRVWLNEQLGVGYSGPAVVGNRVFIMGTRNGNEMLFAIDVDNGREVWATELGDILENGWGDGPRGTPTVDGAHVYALSAQGKLICASVEDGEQKWSRELTEMGGQVPNWGYTESVLVDSDQVICTPGGNDGAIAALNKQSGETVWQSSDFTERAQYASVIATEFNSVRQYIQLTKRAVVSVSAADGTLLWKRDWPGRTAVIPTPIFRDGFVYVSSGYNVGCGLFRLDANHGVEKVYENRTMKNQHGGVILVGDHLYGYSEGNGWVCQDFKTGESAWRSKQFEKGSLISADGMLYCLSEKDGDVVLAEASSREWREVSRFRLNPQSQNRKPRGRIWTHPVVANGKLYLRDQELLFCFDAKQD